MRASLIVAAWIAITGCGPRSGDSDHGELLSLEVMPANAMLSWTGAPLSQEYTAIGTYEDGTIAPVPDASFSLDLEGSVLGTFSAASFVVSGQAAGKGGVLATAGGATGATSVIVTVHPVRIGPGVPANAADKFPDVSPAGALSPSIAYPLDHAVMPTSVKSPNVQWEGTSAGNDLYRVRMTAGFATVDSIVADASGFTNSSQLSEADWKLLVGSSGGAEIVVSVDHWDPTNGAQGGNSVGLKLVGADITGAIYYWNLDAGQMERIDVMGRAPAITYPPPRPGDGTRCVACHAVSKDGRYLSGSLWEASRQGGVFDMSNSAVRTVDPAPTLAPVSTTTYTQLFSTFNADATRLMINAGTSLALIDPRNGTSVATNGTPLPASGAAHPAWSPDGTSIAFANNVTDGGAAASWAVDYTRGDLAVLPASANDTFGPATTLVAAASVDPAFAAPSWPTFTPDSQWIAYGAGVHSRGRNGPTDHPGALFIVNKAGGSTRRLDVACASARNCYLPNFSPYDAGGYFWLVFYSFRDYGNTLAGTKGTGRRQMWITAIDKSKLASGDPSSVPFWLPDQDVTSQNMSAFWALPSPIQ